MKINYNMLFLFGILVIGLLIASFFGFREGLEGSSSPPLPTLNDIITGKNTNPQNRYDNYDHNSQSSMTMVSGTFESQSPNGGTIVANSDGTLTLTSPDGKTIVLSKNDTSTTTNTNTNTNTDTDTESFTNGPSFTTNPNTSGQFVTYYGPDGITATVIYSDSGQQLIRLKDASGTNTVYTQNGAPFNPNDPSTAPPGGQDQSQSQSQGQPYTSVPSSDYSTSYNYSSSLPTGIPASQIPNGQEHMYILKSEVVPPVCPACPSYSPTDTGQKQCQPCPSCARCPEPAFDCKKVPNYNSVNNTYLPVPALADFSTFGM